VKLFTLQVEDDFGKEVYLDFLKSKNWTFLAISIYHEIYGSSPCLEFVVGLGQLMSLLVSIPNWTAKIQLLARN